MGELDGILTEEAEKAAQNQSQEGQSENTAFRTFKTQKEFDDFAAAMRKTGEERALKNAKVEDGGVTLTFKEYEKKYRKDLEAQIKADIERQAKMSEAERFAEERQKLMDELKGERIEINKEKARSLLAKSGFEEDEMEVYLDVVDEDTDISLGRIQRICDSQKAKWDRQQKALISELQKKQPNIGIGGNGEISALKSQYDEAIKSGNTVRASSIIRQAQEQGVKLF